MGHQRPAIDIVRASQAGGQSKSLVGIPLKCMSRIEGFDEVVLEHVSASLSRIGD
jgi:hypothetical protein